MYLWKGTGWALAVGRQSAFSVAMRCAPSAVETLAEPGWQSHTIMSPESAASGQARRLPRGAIEDAQCARLASRRDYHVALKCDILSIPPCNSRFELQYARTNSHAPKGGTSLEPECRFVIAS